MLSISLAGPAEFALAQRMVTAHHYLHTPVDSRTSPLAYIVRWQHSEVGCLIFGRPESTRCYSGNLTAERRQVETASQRSPRSRRFRAARHQTHAQPALLLP